MSTIIGTAGSDTLLGTPSDDYIDTDGGTDSVDAGAGNDIIRLTIVTPPSNQSFGTVDAGAGDDTVQFLGGSGRVSLGDGNDIFSMEAGTIYDDKVTLTGGAGSDLLTVSHAVLGPDTLFDLFASVGKVGTTQFSLTDLENVTVDGLGATPSDFRTVELLGDGGANALTVTGQASATLFGRAGDDVLDGSQLQHALTAYGGSGSDTVVGSEQADWLNGGRNTNEVPALDPGDDGGDTIDGKGGNDHIFGNGQSAVQGAVDGGDLIHGGSGSDYVNSNLGNDTIFGDAGTDRLYGGADDDALDGGAGNDHLNGNKGNDTLEGGSGNDELLGGQGNDRLSGGDGFDTLSGNMGNDIFAIGADGHFVTSGPDAYQADIIADFQDGQDSLALGYSPSIVLHPGTATDAAGAFALASSVLSQADAHAVAAVQVGTDTYLFYDNSGGAPASAVHMMNVAASVMNTDDFTL